MHKPFTSLALAAGVTAALALGTPGASVAAPVSTGNASLQQAVPDSVIQVQRWRRGAFIAGAATAGFIAGAAIASSRPYYYYGPGPYAYEPYPYTYYQAPLDNYGPVYGAAPYAYGYAPYGAPCWGESHAPQHTGDYSTRTC